MQFDKKTLSIDSDDDNENYLGFEEFLEDDTNRMKKKIAREFEEMGDFYLKEKEINDNRSLVQKRKLIPFILKHSEDKYSEEDLLSFSINDIRDIYKQIKSNRSSFFSKLFKFVFNL